MVILVSAVGAETAPGTNPSIPLALPAGTNPPAATAVGKTDVSGGPSNSPAPPAPLTQTNGPSSPLQAELSNAISQAKPALETNTQPEPASQAASSPGSTPGPPSGEAPIAAGRRPDYNSFRLIADRNIFNPNRFPRSGGSERREFRRPTRVDSFSLVGTMSYEKGLFAFFDGSSSDYRKALQLSEAIAGFKVTGIANDRVALASGTNTVELRMGMQMRREEEGDWSVSARSESPVASSASPPDNLPAAPTGPDAGPASVGAPSEASATASTNAEPAATGGSDSDVLKRLMERRAKEMNK